MEEPDFLLFDFFFFSEGCCIELNMTNMPGMFVLRAWESRERPRERHRWHLITHQPHCLHKKQVPEAGPWGSTLEQDASGCLGVTGRMGTL